MSAQGERASIVPMLGTTVFHQAFLAPPRLAVVAVVIEPSPRAEGPVAPAVAARAPTPVRRQILAAQEPRVKEKTAATEGAAAAPPRVAVAGALGPQAQTLLLTRYPATVATVFHQTLQELLLFTQVAVEAAGTMRQVQAAARAAAAVAAATNKRAIVV